MKRPSATVIAVVSGIGLLVITEMIVWWPDPPKKKSEEVPAPPPSEPAPTAQATVVEPPPPPSPAPTPIAPPARPGRDIPKLQADESEDDPGKSPTTLGSPQGGMGEKRRLEGCSGKHCGEPCIIRCDPQPDGRCATGTQPGACTVSGECGTTVPAVCPTEGAGEPPR
jgi:hypothetical protein